MSTHKLREEGLRLAGALASLREEHPFVLAIPRSGVIMGEALARALGAPLDVLVAGKAGGFAAVAEGGAPVIDEDAVTALGLPDEDVTRVLDLERQRQARMLERIRGAWPLPMLAGRTVILVDDAIVTGLTMRAAIAAIRPRRPRRIVVATALCGSDAAAALEAEANEVFASVTAPAALVSRLHDEREPCPPIGDAEIHDLIARELHDVGVDPFGRLAIDGL